MAAEATDAVKAATAREAKRTIVAKGVEDTEIYQNFQGLNPVYRKYSSWREGRGIDA